jgi:hypothetical protein
MPDTTIETRVTEIAYDTARMEASTWRRKYFTVLDDLHESHDANSLLQSQLNLANAALEHPELTVQAAKVWALDVNRRIRWLLRERLIAWTLFVAALVLWAATLASQQHYGPSGRNAPTPSVRVDG